MIHQRHGITDALRAHAPGSSVQELRQYVEKTACSAYARWCHHDEGSSGSEALNGCPLSSLRMAWIQGNNGSAPLHRLEKAELTRLTQAPPLGETQSIKAWKIKAPISLLGNPGPRKRKNLPVS